MTLLLTVLVPSLTSLTVPTSRLAENLRAKHLQVLLGRDTVVKPLPPNGNSVANATAMQCGAAYITISREGSESQA